MKGLLVAPFPRLHRLPLPFGFIAPISQGIKELNGWHSPYLIPGTPHRFGGPVYIGNPTPMLRKSASTSAIFSIICALAFLSRIFPASVAQEVSESSVNRRNRSKKKAASPRATGNGTARTRSWTSATSYPSLYAFPSGTRKTESSSGSVPGNPFAKVWKSTYCAVFILR